MICACCINVCLLNSWATKNCKKYSWVWFIMCTRILQCQRPTLPCQILLCYLGSVPRTLKCAIVSFKFMIIAWPRYSPLIKLIYNGVPCLHKTQGIAPRVWHIIAEQNWEPLGDGFWLNQATELLLASIRPNDPLTLSPNSAQIPPLAGHYRFFKPQFFKKRNACALFLCS